MRRFPLRLRRACWTALLAMLALALAPTLSHALAAARGTADWVEVCTLQGAQRVAVDGQTTGQELPRSTLTQLEHCAYCGLAGHLPALPTGLAAGLSPPRASAGPPPLFPEAPRTPCAWRSAQPRAPPAQL